MSGHEAEASRVPTRRVAEPTSFPLVRQRVTPEADVEFPSSLRDLLVKKLDNYLDAFGGEPDPEAVTTFTIELLELFADERGLEDIVASLEEAGSLEGPLQETLEDELASNDELEVTGEELVCLLERLCDLEWQDHEDESADEDDDD